MQVRQAERRRGTGFPRTRRHEDHRAHAKDLRERARALLENRPPRPEFEIDPRAVLIVELNRPVEAAEWRRAGLGVLDDSETSALVAFADDYDLTAFLARLENHHDAEETEAGSVFASELFDAIEDIRWYGTADRIGQPLADAADDPSARSVTTGIDIEAWHPGSRETAIEWVAVVRAAIEAADGVVVDQRIDEESRVILMRARLSPEQAVLVARIDEIATIDLAPIPHLPHAELSEIDVGTLPPAKSPAAGAPLIALIDSGVSGAHPLIAEALYEATTLLPGLEDGSDAHGHGTGVAGVMLYGPAETWLDDLRFDATAPVPAGRLLSIRVLDHNNEFPAGSTWGQAVIAAIEYAAAAGAKIINLSVGHPGAAQLSRRSTPVASMIDTTARNLGVVVVIPTGNSTDALDDLDPRDYPERAYVGRLLTAPERVLIDPAPAALALTVGGTAGRGNVLPTLDRALGSGDEPSAITRRGPGTARAIKPELVAAAGTLAWNSTLGIVERRTQLGQPLLSNKANALFDRDQGTSYAAPAITHIAARVLGEHPDASPQLLRALVMQSAQPSSLSEASMPGPKPADRRAQRLSLVGHGTPDATSAAFSKPSRVVLTAETTIEVDSVVVYEVPIPSVFFRSGGKRTLDLAIAFDPLTRHRRRDYLASRLFAYVVPGRSVEEVLEVLGKATEEELDTPTDTSEDLEPSAEDSAAGVPREEPESGAPAATDTAVSEEPPPKRPTLTDLGAWKLSPSAPASSDSANTLRRWTRSKQLDPELGDTAYLAIRSTSRWAPDGRQDPVAIALALGYEGDADVDLHAELLARIEQPVVVDVDT